MRHGLSEGLLALKVREERGTVTVRPEVVVEVAFNNVQDSPQYASGMALRFARIVGLRPDKPAAEADTLQTMHGLGAKHADPEATESKAD